MDTDRKQEAPNYKKKSFQTMKRLVHVDFFDFF